MNEQLMRDARSAMLSLVDTWVTVPVTAKHILEAHQSSLGHNPVALAFNDMMDGWSTSLGIENCAFHPDDNSSAPYECWFGENVTEFIKAFDVSGIEHPDVHPFEFEVRMPNVVLKAEHKQPVSVLSCYELDMDKPEKMSVFTTFIVGDQFHVVQVRATPVATELGFKWDHYCDELCDTVESAAEFENMLLTDERFAVCEYTQPY